MTHVTCRLTAKDWDQLRNPTLGNFNACLRDVVQDLHRVKWRHRIYGHDTFVRHFVGITWRGVDGFTMIYM